MVFWVILSTVKSFIGGTLAFEGSIFKLLLLRAVNLLDVLRSIVGR